MDAEIARRLSRAHRLHERAVAERRDAILSAAAAGASTREIGRKVGLSHQRVHQIVHGK